MYLYMILTGDGYCFSEGRLLKEHSYTVQHHTDHYFVLTAAVKGMHTLPVGADLSRVKELR